MSKLALTVFDNTKGHFGHKYINETAINYLSKQINLDYFSVKICHIKNSNDADIDRMIRFYKSHGFYVIVTHGRWSHHNISHQQEYTKDMIRIYSDNRHKYKDSKFNLHLESDFCFIPKNPFTLQMCFERAMAALNQNVDRLTVRFPNSDDELTRLNNVKNVHSFLWWIRGQKFDNEFIEYDENFSQNPHICRTKDLFATIDIVKNNFAQYSGHVEHEYTKAVKLLPHNTLPFLCFDPSVVRLLHLGEKNFPELKEKLEKIHIKNEKNQK